MSTKKKNKSLVKKTRKNRFKNKLSTHIMKGGASYELKIGRDTPLISYVPRTKTFTFRDVAAAANNPKIEKIIFQKQSGYYAQFKILNIFFASVSQPQDNAIDTFLARNKNIYNSIKLPPPPAPPSPPDSYAVNPIYVSQHINTYLTETLISTDECTCEYDDEHHDSPPDDKEEILYNCTLKPGQSINIQVSTHSF